jgi:hypothetical protein
MHSAHSLHGIPGHGPGHGPATTGNRVLLVCISGASRGDEALLWLLRCLMQIDLGNRAELGLEALLEAT